MLFSGVVFLFFFFPLFFSIYYVLPFKFRNAWLIAASGFFYAWGAPTFLGVLLLSAFLDFICVSNKKLITLKAFWWLALAQNIGLLLYFKYANFFVGEVSQIFNKIGFEFSSYESIALPLGISFFTFQKISFLVDVKRDPEISPKSFADYLLFVLMFPQLIAGPIIRFKEIIGQISERTANWNTRLSGFIRFVVGLSKKVLIADQLAPIVEFGFSQPEGGFSSVVALFAFGVQIYFDFSGYSDMAIGLGKMLDFRFPENFHFPYLSHSFRVFWTRWHMTLSAWMRDYLYVPLGGNRRGNQRTFMNLWVVFLLSGLWHGASYNFLIWGAWHGLFVSAEKFFERRLNYIPTWLRWVVTFVSVMLGWVWFRAENLTEATHFFKSLFTIKQGDLDMKYSQAFLLCLSGLLILPPKFIQRRLKALYQYTETFAIPKLILSALLFLLCAGAIATSGEQPFIYFRF